MAFLKEIFWKAYNEAGTRERALDPTRGYGPDPSLEVFMECVAEMDDSHWDEPLTPKAVVDLKKKLRAKNAEKEAARENLDKWKYDLDHPTPETIKRLVGTIGDTALFTIKGALDSDSTEIQATAQERIRTLMAELGKLLDRSPVLA